MGVALTLMLIIAAASHRPGRPELARSIEYYASHKNLDRYGESGQRPRGHSYIGDHQPATL